MTAGKHAWPLFLLAAAAFLPGLGLFFAAAALTWGLLSDRPRALWAAGFAALGGTLNMVAAVVVLWRLHGNAEFNVALRTSVEQDLVKVVQALEDYHAEWHEYPRDLTLLSEGALSLQAVNLSDRSPGLLGTPGLYQYVRSGDGRTYDVFGVGRDERAGTADDVRPTLPDSLASRSGYRQFR